MDIPHRIRRAAERLKEGHRVNRITVRDFLSHFGVERRGTVNVEEIRKVLDFLGLQTDPDFETAWIDQPIRLRPKGSAPPEDEDIVENPEELILGSIPAAVDRAIGQSELAPISSQTESILETNASDPSDPTFRIGRLPAANKALVTVNQNDEVGRAVALMVQYDLSQLPVMQGEREVKGVVSWKSIGWKKISGSKCECVRDCQEDAQIVDSERALFDVIQRIADYGYVLVRQRDRRITGIVTASDLSLQFHALSEPFLLIREIELHIRQLIQGKITTDDLPSLDCQLPPQRRLQDMADLTLGEYVRLLEQPQVWAKLNLSIDRVVVTKLLEEVRTIRNEVMHFDPDPMTPAQLLVLKRAVRLMREVYILEP